MVVVVIGLFPTWLSTATHTLQLFFKAESSRGVTPTPLRANTRLLGQNLEELQPSPEQQ